MNVAIQFLYALGGSAAQAAEGARIGMYKRQKTAKSRKRRERNKIAAKSRARNRK